MFLPINVSGKGIVTQTLFRIAKDLYVGPRFQLRQLDAQIDFSALKVPDLPEEIAKLPQDIVEAVPRDLLSARTVAIGPHLQRDTRNDQFYPTKGSVLNAGGDFFLKALGSKFDYQTYQVRYEGYRSLDERQVLAFGSIGCAAAGDRVPFYDLCLYGAKNYLRGYLGWPVPRSPYAGNSNGIPSAAAETSRHRFTERFGVVGFGESDGLAGNLVIWPSMICCQVAGGGLRFRLTKKYPINFRIDYGIGRVGHTFSMGVGEAF